jgi:hypothetical protein
MNLYFYLDMLFGKLTARLKWKNKIKLDLKEIGKGQVVIFCEKRNELFGSIKGRRFLD